MIGICAYAHHGRSAWDIASGLLAGNRAARVPFQIATASSKVERPEKEAKAAGLEKGDEIVSIGGLPYRGAATPWDAVRGKRPGDTIEVTWRRGGEDRAPSRGSIVLAAPDRGSVTGGTLISIVLAVAMPLLCTTLGFFVAASRPRDPRAWLVLGLMLSFGQLPSADSEAWGPGVREAAAVWSSLLNESWAIFMMLFGLHFPVSFPWERRRPWIAWIPIGILGTLAALHAVVAAGSASHLEAVRPLAQVLAPLAKPAFFLSIACISSFFALLAIKIKTTRNPDARRRLQILRTGATAALTPLLLVILWSKASGRPVAEMPGSAVVPAFLALFLFPMTMAYVIVVQRAMDVRFVLRMGARHLLVKSGLRLLIFLLMLPVSMVVSYFIVLRRDVSLTPRILIVAAFIVIFVLVRRRVKRALGTIDRRFFREAYDEERVLTELGDQVGSLIEPAALLRTVVERIAATIHVLKAAVLVNRGGAYALAEGIGIGDDAVPALASDGRIAEALRSSGGPLPVYLDDPQSWTNREGGLPPDERKAIETLCTELLLPLSARGKLLGMVSLGPKRSEQPYSRGDVRLLRQVAIQTGLALESGRLAEAMAAETAKRARQDREMEIAREVQERLFPQKLPAVSGVDLAGACRPALGIGGDYFDFLELDGGSIGVAIGDVSGKGVPAALLMASLQASLRGQEIAGEGDLARLMSRVNRLVHDTSPDNRYATFFYGRYDPVARRLDYVNAGHNAPFVLRVSGDVERLKAGGMVVGLLPDMKYDEGSVALAPGDLFVGFTDGISEAMNAADEEWGEEKLLETVRAARGEPAARLLDLVFKAADAFAAGVPQYDDMTFVVLRFV